MRQTDKRAALAASIEALQEGPTAVATTAPRGIVGRALEVHKEGLLERLRALEAAQPAGVASGEALVRIDPALIDEPLPADRDPRGFADEAFEALKASIAERGQDTPVTVRPKGDRFELAAGRRRLAACRALDRPVLARVLPLDDEAMLALQYRENAERSDLSPYERGRWLAALAGRGWSTTRLAALTGLSQPSIVDYLRLGRLPEAVVARLSDPRALKLADGRRLQAALLDQPEAPAPLLAALDRAAGRPLREQLARALEAVRRPARPRPVLRGRIVLDPEGRKLVTISRSGNQWLYRWAPEVEETAIAWLAERLPGLLAEWQGQAAAYQCSDRPEAARPDGSAAGSPSR
jgi:ParB family chromosome partitioning protein